MLVAYEYDSHTRVLLLLDNHENFYRDLTNHTIYGILSDKDLITNLTVCLFAPAGGACHGNQRCQLAISADATGGD